MQLLLVAYPGAGKGTQAAKLASHYGIAHLSSGELLRAAIMQGTDIGKIAADYVNQGDLVPDELMFEMLSAPLLEAVQHGGYVLDGFPRNLHQAQMAYSLAQELLDVELQAVIHLNVGRDELRTRLRVRAEREGRADDEDVRVAHRFEVFESETEPLLAFYAERGILVDVDGDQSVDDVFGEIVRAVDSLRS